MTYLKILNLNFSTKSDFLHTYCGREGKVGIGQFWNSNWRGINPDLERSNPNTKVRGIIHDGERESEQMKMQFRYVNY